MGHFKVTMKPETIARRKIQHQKEMEARHKDLIKRLQEKVDLEGKDSIWAEMLEERLLDS